MNYKQSNILVVRNNITIFIWIFTLFFSAIGGIFEYLFLFKPPFEKNQDVWISYLFIFGIGIAILTLISYSLNSHINKVLFDNDNDEVVVVKQYLLKKIVESYNYKEIENIDIEKTTDSDGDNYYKLFIEFKNNDRLYLKEGSHKESIYEIKKNVLKHLAESVLEL